MSPSRDVPLPDRRRFLMLMGLACASTAIAPAAPAIGQPAPVPVSPPPGEHADEPKQASAEALALVEVLRVRYPDHLSQAQRGAVALDLDARLEGGRDLRKLALSNGDEPDATFHA